MPVAGSDEQKQTNEIGMFTALLDAININDKLVTADALLRQRKLADYLVRRGAHYHFTAKGNQATLQSDIAVAAFAPATAQRMSLGCAASPWGC